MTIIYDLYNRVYELAKRSIGLVTASSSDVEISFEKQEISVLDLPTLEIFLYTEKAELFIKNIGCLSIEQLDQISRQIGSLYKDIGVISPDAKLIISDKKGNRVEIIFKDFNSNIIKVQQAIDKKMLSL